MDASIPLSSFKLTPKSIITLTIVIAVVVLVYKFYDEIADMLGFNDETTTDKSENSNVIIETVEKENRKKGLPKPNSKHQTLAQKLFKAMDWYDTDEKTIFNSFKGLTPNDVRLVVEAYGTKRLIYSGYQWQLLGKDTVGTLMEHLRLVLSDSEYNTVRPWLIAAGFEQKPKK